MEATKAILIVSSHLSDAQEIILNSLGVEAIKRINFIKFVIWHCKGDLNQKIDADELWAKFIAQNTKEIYKPSCRHQILTKFLNKK